MALPVTTVRPARGRLVHGTNPDPNQAGLSACGRRCDRWVVTSGPIDCPACVRALEIGR
jgi:hypothetical protein